MRLFIYTLTLLNLLFFAWARWLDLPAAGRQPPAIARLQLLADANATGMGAAGPARCASLGPLADNVAVVALGTALRARNLDPRARQAQMTVSDGFIVFIDHLADAASRARALKRLTRGGVHDAAALADAGQVSVGLFSSEAGADQRARQVRAAGLEPVIEPRSRTIDAYWLDVVVARDSPPPAVPALIAGLNLSTEPAWGDCGS